LLKAIAILILQLVGALAVDYPRSWDSHHHYGWIGSC